MAAVLAACSSPAARPAATAARPPAPAPAPSTTATPGPVVIALRFDRRVSDAATDRFEDVVRATLADARSWPRSGFEFVFTDDAPYTIVLAEGDVVDQLCRPYDVYGQYSCQIGPMVAITADRWRHGTPGWNGDVDAYRQMLVNHEVGHLIGQHHAAVFCPVPGEPAAVMAQQSTSLDGCRPNPWPLPWEIACAARHTEPLAPGFELKPRSACGPDG